MTPLDLRGPRAGGECSRIAGPAPAFARATGASGSLNRKSSRRNVRLGGSSSSGPELWPLPRSAAIGSIVAEPRMSATAGTVRVARRRRRAACAASRRRREASRPVWAGPNEGSSGSTSASAPATARPPKGPADCSRNQSTSVSNHTSPRRHAMEGGPSPRRRGCPATVTGDGGSRLGRRGELLPEPLPPKRSPSTTRRPRAGAAAVSSPRRVNAKRSPRYEPAPDASRAARRAR